MIKEENLLIELCKEVITSGINTPRFNQLWIESGVKLTDIELEIANKLLALPASTLEDPSGNYFH
jgi:hypothetical protein